VLGRIVNKHSKEIVGAVSITALAAFVTLPIVYYENRLAAVEAKLVSAGVCKKLLEDYGNLQSEFHIGKKI
jgi:hypothetical protein